MKYIFEFEQEKAVEFGLDMEDLLILRWLKWFEPEMKAKEIEGKSYYWINYEKLLKDLPILRFKSKDRLYRKLNELVEKGILIHQTVKAGGTYSYYGFGENYSNLLENDGKEIVTLFRKKCELANEELADNFDKIWKLYPRKDGKNTAFNHYKDMKSTRLNSSHRRESRIPS